MLEVKTPGGGAAEARLLSFRALDIEQIGHVYEGLLDHTAVRAPAPVLGLAGSKDREPEIALSELERLRAKGEGELIAFLKEQTGRSESALRKALVVGERALIPPPPFSQFREKGEATTVLLWEERAPEASARPVDPDNPSREFPSPLVGEGLGVRGARSRASTSLPSDHHKLLAACDNDPGLLGRVLPFAGLLRVDSTGRPAVIGAGSVYVTRGSDRRSTGTHYTPRSLTEPIVRYALEPIVYVGPAEGKPRAEWHLRQARELLALKICDMAMGSGAFLVQVCRYLAERLVEAWEEAEARHPGRVVISPEGDLSVGDPAERPLPRDPDERLALARRLVADRCLYGVDVNPMAVEMAKLSLWLVTLQKDRPFTFLDHALRCGDSLLGVHLEQLRTWSLEREHKHRMHWFEALIRRALEHALSLRREIAAIQDLSVRDTEAKARLLQEADDTVDLLELGADLLIAAALFAKKDREALNEKWLWQYEQLVDWAEELRTHRFKEGVAAGYAEKVSQLRTEADRSLGGRRPFHWPLEFPEVFVEMATPRLLDETGRVEPARPMLFGAEAEAPVGFDAIVGNPPFLGGRRITGVFGTDYREYLVEWLAGGARGSSADLCGYFFLRAADELRPGGSLAMLATNTIAQGDTREVGLERLAACGDTIYRAMPSRKWPGEANLEVAHVWLRRGIWRGPFELDDRLVPGITPFLASPGRIQGKPYRLAANEAKSFQGSIVLGMGFVLQPEEAQTLLDKDPRNRDVLFPYLNGEDLNSRPDQSPSRWVINFHDWPLERAETYPDCIAIVREKVKPERQRTKTDGTYVLRRPLPERWWLYADKRPALYAKIAGMERVLCIPETTKYCCFTPVSTDPVFSHMVKLVALEGWDVFALLSSGVHETWARSYASTLESRLKYITSDCFETFPFPEAVTDFDSAGEHYHICRQEIMMARLEGLTKTYNRFHDPNEVATDIDRLRELHVAMDRAVADAYGWTDLDLDHGFHQTKQGLRFTISEQARQEVLDRLLALNHERYAEEVRQGLHEKGSKKTKASGRKAGPHPPSPLLPLWGEGGETDGGMVGKDGD